MLDGPVEEYLNGHMDEIKAEAAADPAVVAATLDVEGGTHLAEKESSLRSSIQYCILERT